MNSTPTSPWLIPLSGTELGCEEQEAVCRVLDSGWLSQGPETEAFESEFARFLGVKHAVAVANGTAALHLAVLAAGVRPGDEVICPSLSFVATANAVLYCDATPVFADIGGGHDLNISVESVLQKLTPRTRAILALHYGGYPCDLTALRDLARQRGLRLIEDACHATGSYLHGLALGTGGDLGCFSFFANKNMTCGEGGMVVTSCDEAAALLRQLRSHGMTSMTWDRHRGARHDYDVVRLGYNYRIDEMRSALGRVQLRRLPDLNRRRRLLTERYRFRLQSLDGAVVPFSGPVDRLSCHLMPLILPCGVSREAFRHQLLREGIQTSVHYPAIHTTEFYRRRFPASRLVHTEELASRIVTLPLFPALAPEQVDWIVDRIGDALTRSVAGPAGAAATTRPSAGMRIA